MATRDHAAVKARNTVLVYLGILTLASVLADPIGLLGIPILFTLKDQLLLAPRFVALFEATTLLPHYLAVFSGVLRDRWHHSGFSDRKCMLAAAPVGVACYLWLAFSTPSYTNLLVTVTIAMIAYQFIDTAIQALTTTIGQRYSMTGRLSALTELVGGMGSLAAAVAGGWMVRHVSLQIAFVAAAVFGVLIFLNALWKPKTVVTDVVDILPESDSRQSSLKTVFKHGAVRFTMVVYILYNFSPGWGTSLFYYLTEYVHMSPEAFGISRAAGFGGNAVATLFYGFYCTRYSLKRLLWSSILLNVFPGVLFLFVQNASQAIAVSAFLGLITGFANVALADLLMRACPKDLEGTASMLCISAFGIAGMAGDLFGAWLFERSGLGICVAMDALATLLIVPFLIRIPAALVSATDGVVVAS